VLYAHFKSEHVIVHHRYVGTPRDPVTARYNESFYRFFARVLPGCLISAWYAECGRLTHMKLPAWHGSNPFWRYGALQMLALAIAFAIGGWPGPGWFVLQAFVAIAVLEMVNYTEHYGLTRKHLGEGRYEPVRPHHSWNTARRITNYLLINLQRHADHHAKPDRRYPLLQNYAPDEAPELPFGYPVMTAMSLNPWLWRRVMNRRVRAWRKRHYPEITDWTPYNMGMTPMPR
jgi:alkane 1-monooxygenase